MSRYQSPLAKAKGLGSAKDGVHHWWMQRLTALALIPLVLWFTVCALKIVLGNDVIILLQMLNSPIQLILFVLLLTIALYHGNLGMHEIIQDYVHCRAVKTTLIVLLHVVTVIAIVSSVLALVVAHLHGLFIS